MVTLLKNDFQKEESRNVDREIALEKQIKHLDNIVFKRDQSVQTVHMLTKPQFFYDNTTKQALGFQNPFYDNMMLEKEKQNSVNSFEPTLSIRPTNVEVPKELPKVNMVNTSLKKLKHHLANFDVAVKERTTPTTITEAQSQEKDTVIKKLKERIETINIELDHRVTKLIAENEHLKQTYKQRLWVMETIRLGMLQFQRFITLKELGIIYSLWDNFVIPILKLRFINTPATFAI
ncbi:hypothetical protein Tco_1545469 [Tanacetum coccineum]